MVTEVLALDVSEEDVSDVEDVPPVLNATVWRFVIAIAMSTSLAQTEEAVKRARKSERAMERMLMVDSSARQGRWKP